MSEQDSQETTVQEINEQIQVRHDKLSKIRELGEAYPNDFKPDSRALNLHSAYDSKTHEELESAQIFVKIAGRVMLRRLMGKASFVQCQDLSGQIQLYVRKQDIADGLYEQFLDWDIGDLIGAEGYLFKTKTGELSVKVSAIRMLSKALRPLPDKWHGLANQETKYRQRYLDLMVNPASRQVFQTRFKIIAYIRQFFEQRDYMEVETPMMHAIPGGAAARPFITHHNSLNMELFMRIAPELYLKRLVVGGFERVFEINRNFRNEGLSTRHNPEFTMIEFYQSYATYHDLMDLTEELLQGLVQSLHGSLTISYQGQSFDFSKFERLSVTEAVAKYNKELSADKLNDLASLQQYLQQKELKLDSSWGIGRCLFEIFEQTVESSLLNPTFITEYPTEVSPLARKNSDNPEITDRFELFIGGREIANGFSELNDPIDQAERFMSQAAQKDAGDHEAMHYDADYIRALEYGMPPTAGEGIGIDRLVMLLTDQPAIRDVILFPHLRPESN